MSAAFRTWEDATNFGEKWIDDLEGYRVRAKDIIFALDKKEILDLYNSFDAMMYEKWTILNSLKPPLYLKNAFLKYTTLLQTLNRQSSSLA